MNSGSPESEVQELPRGVESSLMANLKSLLVIFVAVFVSVIGLVAVFGNGTMVLAASLSAVVCLAGAVGGHFLAIYPRGEVYMATRLYASMAARMGLPFLLLFVCKVRFTDLFSQGMVYFVILFYLVGLVVDLTIRMRLLREAGSQAKPSAMASTAKLDS